MEKHFAALNLLDSDNDCKLTRAFSYSELPSSHRISVKQSYYSANQSGLVRQCSYEQIYDKTTNTRQVKLSDVLTSNKKYRNEWQAKGSISHLSGSSSQQYYKTNNIIRTPKFVPRDRSKEVACNKIENVNDLKDSNLSLYYSSLKNDTLNSTGERLLCRESERSEESYIRRKECNVTNNEKREVYKNMKKKIRPLVIKSKSPVRKKMNKSCCSILCLSVFPILAAILALSFNFDSFIICNSTTLFSNASLELEEKVYGQKDAISNIISFLNKDTFYIKVLCLVGGTGVGKSYTAEILTRNFPYKNQVFTYDSNFGDTIDINALNTSESDVLLIVENLKMDRLTFFSDTISLLSKNKNKCITVVAIFNVKGSNYLGGGTDSIGSKDAITKSIIDANVSFLIVSYEPLTEEILEICIKEIATNSNITLSTNQINTIKEGLILFDSGCKGAYSKVQVIGRE